ncbi:hypothetical protein [Streptomyces minutiscleroticus]|nr:hypothetical protein [Streptomyces minutiscleroticus]
MSTNQPPHMAAAPIGGGGAPDARQLRAILITVSSGVSSVKA